MDNPRQLTRVHAAHATGWQHIYVQLFPDVHAGQVERKTQCRTPTHRLAVGSRVLSARPGTSPRWHGESNSAVPSLVCVRFSGIPDRSGPFVCLVHSACVVLSRHCMLTLVSLVGHDVLGAAYAVALDCDVMVSNHIAGTG